jgi:uncharacterized protein (TIGR00369 family)|tara:strand:+ start:3467 stop:3964 length:498 start_codon:yes stop_codon:yes gene_type:complete
VEADAVSDTEPTEIPEGYRLFEFIDPFEELVGPLCFKVDADGRLRFAFEAKPSHSNTSGQIHGGMLVTFADFALCLAAIHGLPDERCVTVSLNCEFTAAGEVGDFIESTAEVVRRARSLTFVRGQVTAGNRILLNYSGIVKRLPRTGGTPRTELPRRDAETTERP